jgi:hypothetical protein
MWLPNMIIYAVCVFDHWEVLNPKLTEATWFPPLHPRITYFGLSFERGQISMRRTFHSGIADLTMVFLSDFFEFLFQAHSKTLSKTFFIIKVTIPLVTLTSSSVSRTS